MDYKWNMKTVNLYMSTISAYISVRLILYRVNKDFKIFGIGFEAGTVV